MKSRNGESGVILIMVALMTLVLTGMAAYSVDLGDAWYARAQAQTAADAGALSGGVALAKDNTTWPFPAGGIVEASAIAAVNANTVRGTAGTAVVNAVCPNWMVAPGNTRCVRVQVYRDGTNGSTAFPTLFANVLGVTSQGVRATATAQILAANAANCVRPYYIPDRWVDADNDKILDPGEYTEAGGYIIPRDIGQQVTFHESQGPASYGQVEAGGNGVADIRYSLLHCAPGGVSVVIDEDVNTAPGNRLGQAKALKELLEDIDPNAVWNPTTRKVENSCADTLSCVCPGGACPYGGTMSPRIIHAPICDPTVCLGVKNGSIEVTGILSFFIEDYTKGSGDLDIQARLIGSAGDMNDSGPVIDPTKAFTYFISLVQ